MSSDEEHYDDHHGNDGNKKRKITRACDVCRRKKIKCDGPSKSIGDRCSHCIQFDLACTYVEAAKRRGPPKGYIESLENRVARMEALIEALQPGTDFTPDIGLPVYRDTFESGGPMDTSRWNKQGRKGSSAATPASASALQPPASVSAPGSAFDPGASRSTSVSVKEGPDSEEEEATERDVAHHMSHLAMSKTKDYRFLGKSSSLHLVATVDDYRSSLMGTSNSDLTESLLRERRTEFWNDHEWEVTADETYDSATHASYTAADLPPEDLLRQLLDIYFECINSYMPLLHRPTLERELAERRDDRKIGAKILLICALASRYSDDPRVVNPQDLDEHGKQKHRRSAGWPFFVAFETKCKRSFLIAPSTDDLQNIALLATYLQGGPFGQVCWSLSAIGLIIAQDIGVHRRNSARWPDPVDNELRKRAFWTLYGLDRHASAAFGRPCTLRDEDFDVDLPSPLPDEVGMPMETSVIFSNSLIRLLGILGEVLRTIYPMNKKSRSTNGAISDAEQSVMDVAALDSKLNSWLESVPEMLKWNPHREDPITFAQMCFLQSAYYNVQIYIHRPFIPTPRRPSPLRFPSLAICTNAARSMAHVIDLYRRRSTQEYGGGIIMLTHSFMAAIVLLISVWGGKKNGLASGTPDMQMKEVASCMNYIHSRENDFLLAGKLWDVLKELAYVGDLPLAEPSPPDGRDRTPSESSASNSAAHSPNICSFMMEQQQMSPTDSSSSARRIAALPTPGGPRRRVKSGQLGMQQRAAAMERLPMSTLDLAGFPFAGEPKSAQPVGTFMAQPGAMLPPPLPQVSGSSGPGLEFAVGGIQSAPFPTQAPAPPIAPAPGAGLPRRWGDPGLPPLHANGFPQGVESSTQPELYSSAYAPPPHMSQSVPYGLPSDASAGRPLATPSGWQQHAPSVQAHSADDSVGDMWSLVPSLTADPSADEWANFFSNFHAFSPAASTAYPPQSLGAPPPPERR